MTTQILVPLDGSALAETVLPHAATMAHLASGGISLLTAVPAPTTVEPLIGVNGIPIPADTVTRVWEEAHSTARNYLEDVTRRLEACGLEVRSEVVDDLPASAIITYARHNPDVSLIAMATHGFSGLRRWVFGSVAERVLHTAPRPVLLVRPSKEEAKQPTVPVVSGQWPVTSRGMVGSEAKALTTRLDIIVVPLDGSSFAEMALEEARRLALLSGATLALVSAISVPDSVELAQEEFIPVWATDAREHETARLAHYLTNTAERLRCAPGGQGLKVRIELVHGHPAEMILLTADRLHADLIVMATHGRSGMQRLWLGSVAQKLVQGSKLPVLLMRPVEIESQDQDTGAQHFEAERQQSNGMGMAAIVRHHY